MSILYYTPAKDSLVYETGVELLKPSDIWYSMLNYKGKLSSKVIVLIPIPTSKILENLWLLFNTWAGQTFKLL